MVKQRARARGKAKKRAAPPRRSGEDLLPPGVHLSINEAAQEFGADRRTITKKISEAGLTPSGKRQGYAVYRLRDLLELQNRGEDGGLDPEKLDPMNRHQHYKAESEKLKVERERGQLIAREDYERESARVLKVVAQELDTVVDVIERDVGASPLVLEKIEAVIDVIRERMHEGIVQPAPDSTEPTTLNGAEAHASPVP